MGDILANIPDGVVKAYIKNRTLLFWHWLKSSRGFSKPIIEQFELGYAPTRPMFDLWPAGMEGTPRWARGHGDTIYQSQYKLPGKMPPSATKPSRGVGAAISIPIRDSGGIVRGIAARTIREHKPLKDYDVQKYQRWGLLPPYGAYDFIQNAIKEDYVILVEGYTDLWKLYQAGIKNVLSTYGTRGLESFLSPRKKYSFFEFTKLITNKDIWLFMDSDLPGRIAAASQTLLLKKAKRDGIINIGNIYVVVGPSSEGKSDPADLTEEELQSLIAAKPMLSDEYIQWWFEMGIDTNDDTQVQLIRKQTAKLLQEE